MRLNGALDSQPVVKKRRGRRKNVEGMDLLFMNKSRVPAVPDQVSICFFLLCCVKAGAHVPYYRFMAPPMFSFKFEILI